MTMFDHVSPRKGFGRCEADEDGMALGGLCMALGGLCRALGGLCKALSLPVYVVKAP